MALKFIADIGVNHNGSIELAKILAKAAKGAGADFVKLQFRTIEDCYTKAELGRPCKSPFGATVYDKVFSRELSQTELTEFDLFCKDEEIKWTASCFDIRSLEALREFDPPYVKVPACMTEYPELLRRVSQLGFPKIMVSLGLVYEWDFTSVMAHLLSSVQYRPKVIPMHTTSLYPCPAKRVNLARLKWLREATENFGTAKIEFGYSGHEVGNYVIPTVCGAVALGATYIEKHFYRPETEEYCADSAVSLSPSQFAYMVEMAKFTAEVCHGKPGPHRRGDEKIPVKKFVRRERNEDC